MKDHLCTMMGNCFSYVDLYLINGKLLLEQFMEKEIINYIR